MNRQLEQLIHTSDRVEKFLRSNQDSLTSVITSAAHKQFDDIRLRLEDFRTAQGTQTRHARSQVAASQALRRQLVVEHMRPIAAVARARLAGETELKGLAMPTRTNRYGALIEAATSMAEAARVHEARLLEGGLPQAFLAGLVTATQALRDSLSARGQTIALRVKATAGSRQESRALRQALRVLDSLVQAAARTNALLLEEWRSVSRVTPTAASSASHDEPTGPSGTIEAPTSGTPVDTTVNPAPVGIPTQPGSAGGSTSNQEVPAAA